MERDYTGVASRSLGRLVRARGVDVERLAEHVGMDPRDLKKIINEPPAYEWTGIRNADRILLALDMRLGAVVHRGDLTVIPGRLPSDAEKMATDEQWVAAELEFDDPFTPDPELLGLRVQELKQLRESVLQEVLL